ncbi:hypothetical protein B0T20DRAFT_467618 [Sordaria brevicollis]|uniref:Uncharacterized protein n=1 Tax=Sordaria brevicollis TaxID=83679 RepID=A0AAE0PJ06_SORBR|nr:hypothetical protein B0T20DRAFT_467618 [Sordaria brevicollis]
MILPSIQASGVFESLTLILLLKGARSQKGCMRTLTPVRQVKLLVKILHVKTPVLPAKTPYFVFILNIIILLRLWRSYGQYQTFYCLSQPNNGLSVSVISTLKAKHQWFTNSDKKSQKVALPSPTSYLPPSRLEVKINATRLCRASHNSNPQRQTHQKPTMSKRSRDTALPASPSDEDSREQKRQRLRRTLDAIEEHLKDQFGDEWGNVSNSRRCRYRKKLIEPYVAMMDWEQEHNNKWKKHGPNLYESDSSPESDTSLSPSDVAPRQKRQKRQRLTGREKKKPYKVPEGVEVIDLTGDTPVAVKEEQRDSPVEQEVGGAGDGEDGDATDRTSGGSYEEDVKQESDYDDPMTPKKRHVSSSPWSASQFFTPQDPFTDDPDSPEVDLIGAFKDVGRDDNGFNRHRPLHPPYKDPIVVSLKTAEDYENYHRRKRVRFDIMFPGMRG